MSSNKTRPLNPPTPLVTFIKDQATERKIPVADYLNKMLKDPPPTEPSPIVEVLDDLSVGQYILDRLDPAQVDLIQDLCHDRGRTPLEYILNYCRLIHDYGETANLIHLTERTGGAETAPPPKHDILCAYDGCRRPFKPERRGQLYCSSQCGSVVHQAHIRQRARERRPIDAEAMAFAPPTAKRMLYTNGEQLPAESATMPEAALADLQAQVAHLTALLQAPTKPNPDAVVDQLVSTTNG